MLLSHNLEVQAQAAFVDSEEHKLVNSRKYHFVPAYFFELAQLVRDES